MQFKRFEEMPVWQGARKLTTIVYGLTRTGRFAKDFGLRDQIQRSSVSIMSNIAEGYERGSNREFMHYLSYAKGSIGEVRCQLYVAMDLKYITPEEFKGAFELCIAISTQIANFTKYLKNKESD
jgi:four helix bundle protein